MKFIADLHIHSHFSRATSRELNFQQLHKWAQLKGIQVVGTGDLTHPGWLEEMKTSLEAAEEGLFRLKPDLARTMQPEVLSACQQSPRFILSGEISNIYKKHDKTRKNHNVVFLPSFEAVEKFQAALEKIGNIRSDGRPILGLDAHDLLEIVLDTDPRAHLIPAHIWTPWFSLFGSKSGFDTIEECFEDLTPHIFALETGLSSDPPMNWRLSALDRYTLVSNSDAHSPQKLGREANLFDTELSYSAMFDALKSGDPQQFLGTIEFFPQEGKYHYDGHRKCGINWDPKTTLEHEGICPVCGKKVTVGVMHRVEALADRETGERPDSAAPFYSLIPLPEILSEGYNVGVNTKRVNEAYTALLTKLGSELAILQDLPLEEIEHVGGTLLAEGIRRMREGKVIATPGFDGEYGAVKLFEPQEKAALTRQMGFFPDQTFQRKNTDKPSSTPQTPDVAQASPQTTQTSTEEKSQQSAPPAEDADDAPPSLRHLNSQQREAVLTLDRSLCIAAGPGTGKTRVLTHRMAYVLQERGIAPEHLLAMTFSNKAAEEMAERLVTLVGTELARRVTMNTFHAFCAKLLRTHCEALGLPANFLICDETDRKLAIKQACPELSERDATAALDMISAAKVHLLRPDSSEYDDTAMLQQKLRAETPVEQELLNTFLSIYRRYEAMLARYHTLDFDDLILRTLALFEEFPDLLKEYQTRFTWIAVDEYQDLNLPQYRLLRLLAAPETNLCVIGDPDQAIYGFRGANREYFLRFQRDFPEALNLHLTQNYRSTQMIVQAAQQVIAHSAQRIPLTLWTEFVTQTKVDIYQAPTYKAEAEYVVHQVERMVGGTTLFSLDSGRVESHEESLRSFGDFAVLYRLGAQSAALIEAFERSGIPYQVPERTAFHEQKGIREILTGLALLVNPEAGLRHVVMRRQCPAMGPLIEELRAVYSTLSISELIERLDVVVAPQLDDAHHAERVRRLLESARPFGGRIQTFVEWITLRKEIDHYDPRADRVALLTLHASKGLEFPVVFLSGCEDGLIPYRREGMVCDVEEERRLFYVGMTRTQEKLILTYARKRVLFGQTCVNPPSGFLTEIADTVKEVQVREARKVKAAKDDGQLKLW